MYLIEDQPVEEVAMSSYITFDPRVGIDREGWQVISYYWRMLNIKCHYGYPVKYAIPMNGKIKYYDYHDFRSRTYTAIICTMIEHFLEEKDELLPTRGLYYKTYEVCHDKEDKLNSLLNEFTSIHQKKLQDFGLTRESKAIITTNIIPAGIFVPTSSSINDFPMNLHQRVTVLIVEKSTISISPIMVKNYKGGNFLVLETKGYSSRIPEELIQELEKRFDLRVLFVGDKDAGGLRAYNKWHNLLAQVTYLKIKDKSYVKPPNYVFQESQRKAVEKIANDDNFPEFIRGIAREIYDHEERIHIDNHSRLAFAITNLLNNREIDFDDKDYLELKLQ
ncbi:hypothetical protein KGF57_002008 [Candida theae]|uniref:Uncharacterized protein n=1 Tax=Candida theae TaxID=1198502 RepID=A0AAD5FZF0_9ASCO|nr:uncharacterized protein KGF57_002008 [Candida theae]KAI5960008.1 hypothetical protein KGF57_002008 [Candida theae]